jgi:hypothetical protein
MHTHTLNTHTRALVQGKSEVFVVLIVPSCHVPWWSAEGALLRELNVILFWDAIHMENLRRVLKKRSMFKVGGVYSEEVHLYGEVECTSTNCSK